MTQQTEIVLPANPQDKKAIMDCMQELSNSYTRVEAERDFQKEALDELAKKFDLPKSPLRKLSKVLHKGNFEEEASKFEEFQELYDTLITNERNQKQNV